MARPTARCARGPPFGGDGAQAASLTPLGWAPGEPVRCGDGFLASTGFRPSQRPSGRLRFTCVAQPGNESGLLELRHGRRESAEVFVPLSPHGRLRDPTRSAGYAPAGARADPKLAFNSDHHRKLGQSISATSHDQGPGTATPVSNRSGDIAYLVWIEHSTFRGAI